mmetsp:Transcript_29874/g.114681  ORF Transcript_29874/g.114681 Transcript_29874/m.114681 type:complete len:288 (+) Transcript_29874:3550-4413(+)
MVALYIVVLLLGKQLSDFFLFRCQKILWKHDLEFDKQISELLCTSFPQRHSGFSDSLRVARFDDLGDRNCKLFPIQARQLKGRPRQRIRQRNIVGRDKVVRFSDEAAVRFLLNNQYDVGRNPTQSLVTRIFESYPSPSKGSWSQNKLLQFGYPYWNTRMLIYDSMSQFDPPPAALVDILQSDRVNYLLVGIFRKVTTRPIRWNRMAAGGFIRPLPLLRGCRCYIVGTAYSAHPENLPEQLFRGNENRTSFIGKGIIPRHRFYEDLRPRLASFPLPKLSIECSQMLVG